MLLLGYIGLCRVSTRGQEFQGDGGKLEWKCGDNEERIIKEYLARLVRSEGVQRGRTWSREGGRIW